MNLLKSINKILGSGAYLFIATFAVNLSNYGLNLFLGRWLGPEGFAEANIIATIVMVLSFAAMGLQLTVAKVTAEEQLGLLAILIKKVLMFSGIIALLLVLVSGGISAFLKFASYIPMVVLFAGIPFYFLMSISRGYYQGSCMFSRLANTYIIEMVVRVAVTIILLYFLKGKGLETTVVSVGFLASFVVTYGYSKLSIQQQDVKNKSLKTIVPFLAVIAFYELSQIMINNSDVILVKHFFSAHEAGLYGSMALLGRAVFFATWTVVTILFPKVIEREKNGQPHKQLFWSALLVVASIGFVMVLGCYYLGEEVLTYAFGSAYESVSSHLWTYTLFTSLFACANVFVYYNLSLKKYLPVVVSIVFGVLQIILISIFHNSIEQVISIQLGLMTAMLLVMSLLQLNLFKLDIRKFISSPPHQALTLVEDQS